MRSHAQGGCNIPAKDPIVQLEVPGSPFEPVVSADGCWLFVTLTSPNGAGQIAVVRRDDGKLTVVRTVPIKGSPTGAVLTHDGKMLIVADGDYIAFLDAARLTTGNGDAVLGYIGSGSAVGFIYANVTADDKVLFVSAERAESIIVVSLDRVRAGAVDASAAIAKLDVGNAPIAVSRCRRTDVSFTPRARSRTQAGSGATNAGRRTRQLGAGEVGAPACRGITRWAR